MKLPETLTDDVLADEYLGAIEAPAFVDATGLRAVAALAIEHDRAELVRGSGVDVENAARLACESLPSDALAPDDLADLYAGVADALRTAIAQAVAPIVAERDKLAARVAELERVDGCISCGAPVPGGDFVCHKHDPGR